MFSLKRGLYNVCRAILAGRNAILLYYYPLNFFRHIKKVGLNQGGSFGVLICHKVKSNTCILFCSAMSKKFLYN